MSKGSVYKAELMWILPSIALPVIMLGLLLWAAIGRGHDLPGVEGTLDPAQLAKTPPFDKPGTFPAGPNRYQVNMVAGIWSFTPNAVRVPAGSTVEFAVTSRDIVHGIIIKGTSANVMVVPGQVTRFSARFEKPGEYPFVCHEYCGVAHHIMFGKVIAEAKK